MISLTLTIVIVTTVNCVDIGLDDICGNKLVGTCPDKINTKVVGGQSSCAEKVPWNVLIELVAGPKLAASGETILSTKNIFSLIYMPIVQYSDNVTNTNPHKKS